MSSGNVEHAGLDEVGIVRHEIGELKEWLAKQFSSVFAALAQKEPSTKDKYTPAEVAVIVGRRPYTVREWCRYGRIRAEKVIGVGRGSEEAWRISHAELTRYLNEGLLPGVRPKY